MDESSSPKEILEDILRDVEEMLVETQESKQELDQIEADAKNQHKQGKTTDLVFEIHKQQLRRGRQRLDDCVKNLLRQKKIAAWKLRDYS